MELESEMFVQSLQLADLINLHVCAVSTGRVPKDPLNPYAFYMQVCQIFV